MQGATLFHPQNIIRIASQKKINGQYKQVHQKAKSTTSTAKSTRKIAEYYQQKPQ